MFFYPQGWSAICRLHRFYQQDPQSNPTGHHGWQKAAGTDLISTHQEYISDVVMCWYLLSQVIVCSATLHSFDVKKLSERIMHFPTWVDLKGEDSVPETVHHVVVPVNPKTDRLWERLGKNHIQVCRKKGHWLYGLFVVSFKNAKF